MNNFNSDIEIILSDALKSEITEDSFNEEVFYKKIMKRQKVNSIFNALSIILYFLSFGFLVGTHDFFYNISNMLLYCIISIFIFSVASILLILSFCNKSLVGRVKFKYKNTKLFYIGCIFLILGSYGLFGGFKFCSLDSSRGIGISLIGVFFSSFYYHFVSPGKRRRQISLSNKAIIFIVLLCFSSLFGSFIFMNFGSESYYTNSIVNYGEEFDVECIEYSGGNWFTFLKQEKNGQTSYSLSVHDVAEDLRLVYETEPGVMITSFHANKNYAVWTEVLDNVISYNYYSLENDRVYEISSVNYSLSMSVVEIGLYKDKAYFKNFEEEEGITYFMEFDFVTKEMRTIETIISEKAAVTRNNLSVYGNKLFISYFEKGGIKLLINNLDDGTSQVIDLGNSVYYLRSAITEDDYIILYYYDGVNKIGKFDYNGKLIQVINEFDSGDGIIKNRIDMKNGELYWNDYVNGNYHLNVYNIKSEDILKVKDMFNYVFYDEYLYSLGYYKFIGISRVILYSIYYEK